MMAFPFSGNRTIAAPCSWTNAILAPWALEEMECVDLADKRLDNRVALILSALGGGPAASIPAACGGHMETTAAHRFFDTAT